METLPPNLVSFVQSFYKGLILDVCIEPSRNLGMLFPSIAEGARISITDIKKLRRKNLLDEENVIVKGLEYQRYTISTLARKLFEEYKNDYSN